MIYFDLGHEHWPVHGSYWNGVIIRACARTVLQLLFMQINGYLYDFKNEQKLRKLCTKFSISFRPTKQLLVTCPKPNRKSAIFYFVLIFGIQMIATKQEVAVTWLHMVESTPVLTCLVRVPAWAHLCTDVCFQLQHLLVAAGNDIFLYLYVLLLEGVRKSLTPCWRYTGKIVVSSWTPVRYYFTQLDHRSFLELSQHSPPLLPLDSWAFLYPLRFCSFPFWRRQSFLGCGGFTHRLASLDWDLIQHQGQGSSSSAVCPLSCLWMHLPWKRYTCINSVLQVSFRSLYSTFSLFCKGLGSFTFS